MIIVAARSLVSRPLLGALQFLDLGLDALELFSFGFALLGFPSFGFPSLDLQSMRFDPLLTAPFPFQPLHLLSGGSLLGLQALRLFCLGTLCGALLGGGASGFYFLGLATFRLDSGLLHPLQLQPACLWARCL
jgi:hypothetical protein